MAVLTPIHWQMIAPQMHVVLRFVGQCPFAGRFYLAGGTALALRLGHRRSVDLDFFSETDEVGPRTRHEIVRTLAPLDVAVLENVDGNLLTRIAGMHVGFFSYGYPLLSPVESVENVALAAVLDIALMKLDALIGRGSRKDFYDLYVIAQQMPIHDLLDRGAIKYPHARDFAMMALESMVLFDNADRDVQPDLLIDVPWERVRHFFIEQARALGERWFGGE
ncbi:MAG: nucleotidyl transferase AbiEii/AbiGii toxin family protein [Anaerolineae bacterium]|nr:nucleotidyl transferase AbiEii/AbiGii toxin family protein [Anaerolineae bacterium]